LRWRNKVERFSLCAYLTLAAFACRKSAETSDASVSQDQVAVGAELIFPEAIRVGDESVNQFVRTALTECTTGDYEAFRSLWSAKREPISRGEFEEGWHAVHRIEVRGLRRAILETDEGNRRQETVYVLLASVELRPEARLGKRASDREIVSMLVREHDQWRLAPAPKDMRDWIKKQAAVPPPSVPSASSPP
jgi:hypothetical protein